MNSFTPVPTAYYNQQQRPEEAAPLTTPIPIFVATKAPSKSQPIVPVGQWMKASGLSVLEATLLAVSFVFGGAALIALLAASGTNNIDVPKRRWR